MSQLSKERHQKHFFSFVYKPDPKAGYGCLWNNRRWQDDSYSVCLGLLQARKGNKNKGKEKSGYYRSPCKKRISREKAVKIVERSCLSNPCSLSPRPTCQEFPHHPSLVLRSFSWVGNTPKRSFSPGKRSGCFPHELGRRCASMSTHVCILIREGL